MTAHRDGPPMLEGRIAIVTGATRGLGRAVATGLAEHGAKVAVIGRDPERCDRAAVEIADQTGSEAIGIAWHAGDWDGAPAVVERCREAFGDRLDILVNNAGINPGMCSLTDMSASLWDKVMEVNVRGPLRLSGLAAPVMSRGGGGSIINITSLGAYRAGAMQAHYAASKAALTSLTRSMASEWAELGVRVNAIAPGPFLTDMTKGGMAVDPNYLETIGQATLQKRVADPAEIIGPVLYLVSDASSYVTGEDHVVAGGMFR